MCGICGVVTQSHDREKITRQFCERIEHRGPDQHGIFSGKENVVFGHQRLSIIDLSENGRQPMKSQDGSIVVVFNGEIYNYRELYRELSSRYVFRSKSDTEVLIYGYIEWGIDVLLEKLRGMFAFALLDVNQGVFHLVRDRIGIKPVYYIAQDNFFAFSSEIKSFTKLPQNIFSFTPDLQKMKLLLGFNFLPDNENTIIEGIKKLPPGSYMTVECHHGKVLKQKKYWHLQSQEDIHSLSFEEAAERLDHLLNDTVREHLSSDVPVGTLLSGGLDSSLISALVKKNAGNNNVETFNAMFHHPMDESMYAKKVSQYIGTTHHVIPIDVKEINDNIEKYIYYYDDLSTFDGGLMTTKLLCDKIRQRGIKVLLLGEGADEIFGGYSWFGLSQLPFSLLPHSLQTACYYFAISRNTAFWPFQCIAHLKNLYNKNRDREIFDRISRFEVEYQLPNHYFMKVDKGSMASSIEARVPYVDHRVVEFVYSLPRSYKLNGKFYNHWASNEKYILRKIAEKYLPYDIVWRKKRGFMLPINDVLQANISKVKDYALAQGSISRQIFGKRIEKIFNPSSNSLIARQNEWMLWRIFLLEVWYSMYAKKR